ncbi:TIGR01620 family protein [Necropsobacter massiliensis]|uniref:TIGR01620 family protein n=1 Tax=Necropsobacter massiliensis TaxID=1400001 RepID=UPI000595A133|nr:TIGR01620 family protein [Necropsobacter massiliensis]
MQKQIFTDSDQAHQQTQELKPKQEFDARHIAVEPDSVDSVSLEGELLNQQFEQIVAPKPRWWKKALAATALLFGGATVAQTLQWLIDSWQQHQWIYFAFALVSFSVVILGISALAKEWRRLARLKKRMLLQQQSERILGKSAVDFQPDFSVRDGLQSDAEQGKKLCAEIVDSMQISTQAPAYLQWQRQVNDGYSAQEVTRLFSRSVLKPVDQQAKKLISKNALEAAMIVAVSPLAIVDMFFIAWRNIRLINRLADIYAIELGYVSRLRLLRMVFLNIAFAGATEVVQDMGMEWLSQDITAKLSARVAQGLGVGLLTARLGIKAMEFCRPLAFEQDEKPRLSHIQKELLTSLKNTVLGAEKSKQQTKL